jgi:hypothetical protein
VCFTLHGMAKQRLCHLVTLPPPFTGEDMLSLSLLACGGEDRYRTTSTGDVVTSRGEYKILSRNQQPGICNSTDRERTFLTYR